MGKIGLAIAKGKPLLPDWIFAQKHGRPFLPTPADFRASMLGVPYNAGLKKKQRLRA